MRDGKLKVLGIVEEQHPDRAELFMQWQEMAWPVMSDPLNLLGVSAVPYTFLIDEHGIIRYKNPEPEDLETFLTTTYLRPAAIGWPDVAIAADSAEHALMWGDDTALEGAIGKLEARAAAHPEDATTQFRLGVAYRMRHDSTRPEQEDFAKAVAAWRRALDLEPGQYIWRRRIQQYGPRLDKPYSFYDWVNEARATIRGRGQIPHPLPAEPGGSEFAYPGQAGGDAGQAVNVNPDPTGELPADRSRLVGCQVVVVPSTDPGKPSVRVHLRFQPSQAMKVHWSNDAGPLSLFLVPDPRISIHDRQLQVPPAAGLTSSEERRVEFEVRPAAGQSTLPASLKATAFYYVCEDTNGLCQFLRQVVEIPLRVRSLPQANEQSPSHRQ